MATPSQLMSRQAAADVSFAELAKNIRQNLEWAKQAGGDPLDPDLLMLLVIELRKKTGGPRPELPPKPVDPLLHFRGSLVQSHPTSAQFQTKKRLVTEMRNAERERHSPDPEIRRIAEQRVKAIQTRLEDLRFNIALSGLLPDQQRLLRAELGSPEARKEKTAAYQIQLERYEQDTVEVRRAIEEWDAQYGANSSEYSTRLRIVERLRADCEAYARGEFRIPIGKLSWRILPPGHWGSGELAAIHAHIRRRNPGIRLDETRLPHADSLGPKQKFIGENEFDGYFVFLFDKTDRVLLENPIEGNAAYIFRGDWTFLSKLSKGELLEGYRDAVERIFHRDTGNWKWQIKRALGL